MIGWVMKLIITAGRSWRQVRDDLKIADDYRQYLKDGQRNRKFNGYHVYKNMLK